MHAPLMPRRVRSEYTPWVTPALMREMKHRDYLNRRAVASKCDTKFTAFTSIKVNNNIYRSEEKIADNPNTYVSEIGEKRPSNPENTDRTFVEFITPLQSQFNFSLFTDDLIERSIKELKPCKSAGLDKISARLLKDSSVVVVPYLRVIFNLSLHQGIFPGDWKHARISPIFKSGDTEDCSNYRPISVLSIVSNVFEKLVYLQLYDYFTENGVLSRYQSVGFRKGYSTLTSLLRTTDSWLVNIDRGLVKLCHICLSKERSGTSIQDIESKLNGELNNLYSWFLANKLTLNASKWEYMIVGCRIYR